jgi:hypothetical protein
MAAQTRIVACAVWIGLLSWFVPFVFGFLLLPIKKWNAPLFSTLMYLVVVVTAGALLAFYFRHRAVAVGEAGMVRTHWLAMNLVLDYPMFAYGPMKMTPLGYYPEIGMVYLTYLTYLTYPAFALLAARLAKL